MKKKYVYPAVYCESFVLSQHIASCGVIMQSNDEKACAGLITEEAGKKDPIMDGTEGALLFANTNTSCVVPNQEYCYTNSTNDIGMLFMS